jgi:hypothetical protein
LNLGGGSRRAEAAVAVTPEARMKPEGEGRSQRRQARLDSTNGDGEASPVTGHTHTTTQGPICKQSPRFISRISRKRTRTSTANQNRGKKEKKGEGRESAKTSGGLE